MSDPHSRDRLYSASHQVQSAEYKERLQEIGCDLVNQLFMYMRALQLYRSDNEVFHRPLHLMANHINWVIAREGRVRLFGDASTIYLNEVLLRFPFSSLPSVNFLLETWSSQGIGGISIDAPIRAEELRVYLQQFSADQQERQEAAMYHGSIQAESIGRVRYSIMKAAQEGLQQISQAKVDPHQYAILLYSRLLQLLSKMMKSMSDEQDLLLNQITRTLQELIDLSSNHSMHFLGFTNETDPRAYEGYHTCNTVFFSILFGQHLGLSRVHLLDLGLAAALHNIGKRWIPTSLLDKYKPLSPQEQRMIRKIGIYTVQEVLKGSFQWEKVQRALTVAGVYAPPTQGAPAPHDARQAVTGRFDEEGSLQLSSFPLEGPPLYSHMIRLCATFDALCTRRPYRVKLFPAEALMKMRNQIDYQFEPYLLRRFIAFFSPMALSKLGNKQSSVSPPPEDRSTRAYGEALSPFGFGIVKEYQQYTRLRRAPRLTEEQARRLQKMRAWINKKTDILGLFGQQAAPQQAQEATKRQGRHMTTQERHMQTIAPPQQHQQAPTHQQPNQPKKQGPGRHMTTQERHMQNIRPPQPSAAKRQGPGRHMTTQERHMKQFSPPPVSESQLSLERAPRQAPQSMPQHAMARPTSAAPVMGRAAPQAVEPAFDMDDMFEEEAAETQEPSKSHVDALIEQLENAPAFFDDDDEEDMWEELPDADSAGFVITDSHTPTLSQHPDELALQKLHQAAGTPPPSSKTQDEALIVGYRAPLAGGISRETIGALPTDDTSK